MATTENSYTTSNATTTDFAFTFPYLKQADVKIDVAGVTQSTTAYSFHNATTIRLDTAPASGVVVRVYRSTDDSGLISTFYPGSAIRSGDLNDNFTQNLYSTQENTNDASDALDNSRVLESGAYVSAITKAAAAVVTSDAANATAATASTVASGAAVTAGLADGKADTAIADSASAVTTAGAASTLATQADGKADTAIADSSSATTNATAALNNSRESDGSGGYTSAIDKATTATNNASAAVITANAAEAAVADAGIYITKANYAALPTITSSNTGDFYQITDSSNIDIVSGVISESGISNPDSHAPDTFTGGTAFTVKFKANNSTGKWEWQAYFANDPESRYRNNVIIENQSTISQNYTISQNSIAISYGPVAIASGYTVTIPSTSSYRVI